MEEFKTPTKEDAIKLFKSDRLLRSGLLLIIASTIFFAIAGALAGWLLGIFAPDYYRINLNFEPGDGDPSQVGLGLGLYQGALAGLIAGCVVILATAIFKSHIRKVVIEQLDD